MNTRHDITVEELMNVTVGFDGDYKNSQDHPITLEEVINAGRNSNSPFTLAASPEHRHMSGFSMCDEIAKTFLDELEKAGFIIVKKGQA